MKKHLYLTLIPGLLVLLIWLAFYWEPQTDGKRLHAQLSAEQAPAGGDFTLRGSVGPVSLKDYRGKVVALYFGYTFCPDVCPTSLAALAQAFSLLTADELERARGLFVSVDPERDTLDVLKVYVPYFHPSFTGITGTPDEVAVVARQYGVRYMKQKPNADGLYPVDHSASTYLVAPDGRLAATLPHGTPPQEIHARIRKLINP